MAESDDGATDETAAEDGATNENGADETTTDQSATDDISCSPIGAARTPFETRADAPRQGVEEDAVGEIVLEPEYEAGLQGIEPGDDLLVLWYADEADSSVLEVERGGHRGVFASRSPDRPVPIGLTSCTVEGVEGRRVAVRGVDMLDGSPVLDLKPPLSGCPHG